MIKEATLYARGEFSQAQMVELLHRTRPKSIGGRSYGESNQKLAFIIPALLEAFPGCKLIWLVRDGRSVVNSIYSLGWYDLNFLQDSLWQKYLVTAPDVGEMVNDVWRDMSSFSKCCWYWSFVNRCIKKELDLLPRNQWQLQKIENVNCKSLLKFLHSTVRAKDVPWVNKKKKSRSVQDWHGWSEEMKQEFQLICGNVMHELYPGWRDGDGNWVDFHEISPLTKAKHYFQDKLVDVQGKQSWIYKFVSWPTRLLFRSRSEAILEKFALVYRWFSGES
ncbi:MAG: hypothetical protein M0017_12660 [Desulfobacteraceae bacterium]|nr:hypothetical protein [Desulfobacteraceae bacterium]